MNRLKNVRPIILASGSDRRKKLLKRLGLRFKVIVPTINEYIDPQKNIKKELKRLATSKASYVAKKVKSGIVIGADTIVVAGKKIFGKPKNIDKTRQMLKDLSNTTHYVLTGVCILDIDNKKKFSFVDRTIVKTRKLSNKTIERLSKRGLGKAGGYAVQLDKDMLVKDITGSFSNVVGLPMERLIEALKKFDIKMKPFKIIH